MSSIKYDPELPYAVIIREDDGSYVILARCSTWDYANQLVKAGTLFREIVDTTPKPKIPKDAEFVIWDDPSDNGEERIARRYGHPANKVWRIGWDTLEESELMTYIGDAEVTVLVRKEET